ncbi:MAG TPA: transcriptional regulator FtrA [Allosphingosinicella sp.]|jgi:AraC family transcriptional activator FtrA
MAKHLVASLVYDGLCAFEFGCTFEIFGLPRPELQAEWYDFVPFGMGEESIRAAGGLTVTVARSLDVLEEADTIVISGWRGIDSPVPEALAEGLRAAHRRGARIASICSGAFVLAAAGLLDGRRATTHWRYTEALAARFPRVRVEPDVLYIDEGSIVTSAGSAAGLDMMLHLVRRDRGAKICNAVARRLVIPPHRDGGQAQFVERPVPVRPESRLTKVIEYLRANPTREHRTRDLAEMAAMSPRSFFRKFKEAVGMAPYDWLLRERVEIAKQLLEDSGFTIDQIADEAGFGASETFRHHFRRVVGTSPAEYRRMFSIAHGERHLRIVRAA